jgi:hypothetical protein
MCIDPYGSGRRAAVWRAAININNIFRGPNDGTTMNAVTGVKSVDPYDISIVMPAQDGDPVVSEADKDAWTRFRVAYDVTLEATPFRVTGVLYLLPSMDPWRSRSAARSCSFRYSSPWSNAAP